MFCRSIRTPGSDTSSCCKMPTGRVEVSEKREYVLICRSRVLKKRNLKRAPKMVINSLKPLNTDSKTLLTLSTNGPPSSPPHLHSTTISPFHPQTTQDLPKLSKCNIYISFIWLASQHNRVKRLPLDDCLFSDHRRFTHACQF